MSLEKDNKTKIISIFAPLKVCLQSMKQSEFNDNCLSLAQALTRIYDTNVIAYFAEKEQLYSIDLNRNSSSKLQPPIVNRTIVLTVSVPKEESLSIDDLKLNDDFKSSLKIVRVHRKKIQIDEAIFSYVYYTINATHLLNAVLGDSSILASNGSWLVLSANNIRRTDGESNSLIEKICDLKYIDTLKNEENESLKRFRRKLSSTIELL